MSDCLFVVIGAGASFDSTSPENVSRHVLGGNHGFHPVVESTALKPPLVTELFDPRFAGILNRYPVAQMAASDIRKQSQTPVAIEDFLRERYRDSEDELDRRKFHAVHWYLQELLWCASHYYTSHPDNYDRLVSGCVRLPRVVFITLNYDTLLDDRLRIVAPIAALSDYTAMNRHWGLIKLHGSVDWGMPINDVDHQWERLIFDPPAGTAVRRDEIVLRPGNTDIRTLRVDQQARQIYYPAMSVPVGTRDEFSCPPAHVEYLRACLSEQSALDVLMLGYSALDEEVLQVFRDSGKPLRSLWAVNEDAISAGAACQQVTSVLGSAQVSEAYQGGFADFVGTDHFDGYLTALQTLRS